MVKVREGIGEIKLTQQQIDKVEEVAKNLGIDRYLLIRLWGRRGLRVSEPLGLHKSDIDSNGIWITQKGGDRVLKILPPDLYSELAAYAKHFGKSDLLFPITRRTAYNWSQDIAKRADIPHWERAHPHRWRHFFRDLPSQTDGKGPLEGQEPHGTQGSPSNSSLRGRLDPRGRVRGIVKIRLRVNRLWLLGGTVAFLLYHSYGILSGVYSGLDILPYDYALLLGVLEAIISPFLTLWFLWRLFLWLHDHRSTVPRHVFDDPGILA